MFKIAYCAGHDLSTPGKRLPAALDENQTREWVLNDRVARYFAQAAEEYEGVELLRTDDPSGKTFIDIPVRAARANAWGADLYLDIHHNAGIGGGTGGGVIAYCYPGSTGGRKFRDAIYGAVLAAGGLRGNRAQPLQEMRFDSLVLTNMPAVLVECGFMDSSTDAPVILTEDYSRRVGEGIMEGIAQTMDLARAVLPQRDDFVREVQRIIGAAVDGIPGPETMGKTVTLSAEKNSTHPLVAVVQRKLAELGYSQVGEADGIAGPKFTAAVKAFQGDHGCWVDGEITAGNKTWRTLLTQ